MSKERRIAAIVLTAAVMFVFGYWTGRTPPNWWPILAGVAGAVAIAGLLYVGSRNRDDPMIRRLGPSFFFWLEMVYLAILVALPIVYNLDGLRLKTSIDPMIGGILHVGVPWFGALGAVTISLQGVFKHNTRWRESYNYWYVARPLFGAVLGIVAYFLFLLIMQAAGSPPEFLEATDAPDPPVADLLIYWVVAFLVGYREETFRELIKRATDLVLQPEEPPTPQESSSETDDDSVALKSRQ